MFTLRDMMSYPSQPETHNQLTHTPKQLEGSFATTTQNSIETSISVPVQSIDARAPCVRSFKT